jgi:DNA ligase D-like protein (predicted 3'-phosphoesterase)
MTLWSRASPHPAPWAGNANLDVSEQGRFVIQHHLATADHYDLRLEIDGVLVSWAVPKGPSPDPRIRRMAIRTDDHELDHQFVEGGFGRSTVLVWDRGSYDNASRDGGEPITATAALARGQLSVRLHGEKLRGGWTLIRLPDQRRETWLLLKKADADADPGYDPVATAPNSVLSGRTMEQIAADQPCP